MPGFINRWGRVFFKQTLTSAGYSDIVIPDADPAHLENIFILVTCAGDVTARAIVQFTGDDPQLVKANDSSVTWVNWTNGELVAGESSYNIVGRAMTGIRFQQTGTGTVVCVVSY